MWLRLKRRSRAVLGRRASTSYRASSKGVKVQIEDITPQLLDEVSDEMGSLARKVVDIWTRASEVTYISRRSTRPRFAIPAYPIVRIDDPHHVRLLVKDSTLTSLTDAIPCWINSYRPLS